MEVYLQRMMARILREQFVYQYQTYDVLTQFREEMAQQLPEDLAAKLPAPPARGTLDLASVLESEYFFA